MVDPQPIRYGILANEFFIYFKAPIYKVNISNIYAGLNVLKIPQKPTNLIKRAPIRFNGKVLEEL